MMAKLINSFLSDLASPINLLWFWNFGFMLGTAMVFQVVSGLLLSFYYNDSMILAFYSVLYLMLEIESGSLFRFFHASGASLLFFLVYVHISRSLWFKSFLLLGFDKWAL